MQRRLDVGGVIRRVWSIYVDQAAVLMPAAAVVFVIEGLIAALLASSGSFFGLLLAEIIAVVASVLFTGMVVELVADVQDGRRDASAGQLLRAVTPVLGQLILVGFVAGIGIVIGFVLIIVPGLILITIWSVFVPVIVLERAPGLSSLGRSRELVRGNGWQVFGVLFVLFVLVGVLTAVLDGAAASTSTGVGIVVRVVLGVLTAPFGALAAAVLYFDLRAASADGAAPTPGAVGQSPTSTL
jgi:ABC-type multidrug transport system fused ATPase/permease subunit